MLVGFFRLTRNGGLHFCMVIQQAIERAIDTVIHIVHVRWFIIATRRTSNLEVCVALIIPAHNSLSDDMRSQSVCAGSEETARF